MYCIDASVFINAEIEGEEFHEHSAKLMQNIRDRGITIIVPEIVLPEIAKPQEEVKNFNKHIR